ncbi:DoxX family protein [Cellulomonas sp. Root485]|nr:DoxX family protein [Cellulomonas sp. Root485]
MATVLARHSITALRISLGLVFLGFGVLKFFPGMSPAAELAERTIGTLTFGLVGPTAALLLTAIMETVIGLTLVTGLFLRTGLVILAGALVGIMSPLALFYGELFPAGGPTLTAQYVLKDIVLACAGAVIGAAALGARLRLPE